MLNRFNSIRGNAYIRNIMTETTKQEIKNNMPSIITTDRYVTEICKFTKYFNFGQ